MSRFKPLLSNRPLTLSLLFFTVLTTQQISQLTFDFGYEYYPYFIAVGVVIFSIKVFFTAYYALSHELETGSVGGLVSNLGFVVAQLWLLQTCLQYLVTSYYPEGSFRVLMILGILFVLQMAVNGYEELRGVVVITALYYTAVYIGMRQIGLASTSTLGLQALSIVVPGLELYQLGKLLATPQQRIRKH